MRFLQGLIALSIVLSIVAGVLWFEKCNFNADKYMLNLRKTMGALTSCARIVNESESVNFSMVSKPCSYISSQNNLSNSQYDMSFCSILNSTLIGYKYYGKLNKNNNHLLPYSFKSVITIKKSLNDYNLYQFADGVILGVLDGNAKTHCSTLANSNMSNISEECVGFIDINGIEPPNKEAVCADGTTTLISEILQGQELKKCKPSMDKDKLTDIYPILFHDNTVELATTAGKEIFVLDRKNYNGSN